MQDGTRDKEIKRYGERIGYIEYNGAVQVRKMSDAVTLAKYDTVTIALLQDLSIAPRPSLTKVCLLMGIMIVHDLSFVGYSDFVACIYTESDKKGHP